MTLWKHFQQFVCISNNGLNIVVGSNMLACQCFFVGQSVLYKKAEKAEKSVQPVVAVPRLGGSWHVGLEM